MTLGANVEQHDPETAWLEVKRRAHEFKENTEGEMETDLPPKNRFLFLVLAAGAIAAGVYAGFNYTP